MKVFDSGMPDEAYWQSLFDIPAIVEWLHLELLSAPIAEIGCGYGTFTVPIAKQTSQTLHAIDIEPQMIQTATANVLNSGLQNVVFHCRDVLKEGTGLPSGSIGLVILFNILHSPERVSLLKEAERLLEAPGRIAIIHWRKDIPTPRGPKVESRPDEQIIRDSVQGTSLQIYGNSQSMLPYHWGTQLVKEQREL